MPMEIRATRKTLGCNLFAISRPIPTQKTSLGTPRAASLINVTNGVVTLRHTSKGFEEVSLFSSVESQDRTYCRLWRSQIATTPREEGVTTLTAALPLEFNSLIFGYSDGRLRRTSFSSPPQSYTRSHLPHPPLNQSRFYRFSMFPTFLFLHPSIRFTSFAMNEQGIASSLGDQTMVVSLYGPVRRNLSLTLEDSFMSLRQQEEHAGPLRGCALCISMDGTITVIAMDGFELLYVLPGASSVEYPLWWWRGA
ncbi:hypothetical protein EV363DRAFT_958874 [Boletus edulis]|nr:hypothetical protein EV363DRAFT_958874 [Boletus edulis]